MKLLLDTHIFLWLVGNPEQLSPKALAACEDLTNDLYLSVGSAWEIPNPALDQSSSADGES